MLIRLIFEGYLELILSVLISLTDMQWSGELYNNSVLYTNIFSIVVTIFLLGMPIFILGFYWKNIDKLEDKEFVETYGDIYDGLALSQDKESRKIALFYPFWFVVRRMLFAFVVIFA